MKLLRSNGKKKKKEQNNSSGLGHITKKYVTPMGLGVGSRYVKRKLIRSAYNRFAPASAKAAVGVVKHYKRKGVEKVGRAINKIITSR